MPPIAPLDNPEAEPESVAKLEEKDDGDVEEVGLDVIRLDAVVEIVEIKDVGVLVKTTSGILKLAMSELLD